MEGVKKAVTDGKSLTAIVDFDPSVVTAEEIAEGLGKANARYKATVREVSR